MILRQATFTGAASLACAALVLSGAPPATASTAAAPVKVGNVQKAMEDLVKTGHVVGAIGEVYVDGKRVGKGSAGSRLLDGKGGAIPASARYWIGSQTKAMTATAVLQLVREGKLSVDDKLSEVLPEVAEKDLVERADEITVRNLIQLTSGIPDYIGPDTSDPTRNYRPTDLLAAARKNARPVEVGTFNYSNSNYILLGMIIEKLSGRSLAAELNRRLFAPLGMRHTYLPTKAGQGIKGPHGHGYAPDETGTMRDVDKMMNATSMLGAGGVISTTREMSVFQRAFRQNKLLPASLSKLITDPPPGQTPPPAGTPCAGNPEFAAGGGGSAPGFTAATITSSDGRLQFAVSLTLAMDNDERSTVPSRITNALKSLFCPAK
ncbi:serine hydrolase domain-containing protein [Nonomuraea wenchangensis]|uniref:D-alanyl-D-alanine carboxypeptidase n=1 Tax=Nonomuraea wenchangensis TaxID=568860 RepID=A0A1I0LQ82_9ACTN|nr:serine hydrolase domain-containing protein [Nonomuraea wenchangensis]SEU44059.1 D-alanyl-D-alanine carboxypeptidase [Nonomuraea wenchangensis]